VLSIEERAEHLLEQARGLAGRVASGAEFSNAIFAPDIGLASQAFPTLRERREFTLTPQYAEIYRMLGDLIHKFGAASRGRPQLSHEQSVRMRRQAVQTEGRERTP
jgi:hypothetical protein